MFLFIYFVLIPSTLCSLPYLLLVSFDGFRFDYPEIYNLTTFKAFASNGTSALRMQSCFATVTFPNHFSLATGFFEESHGIVSNNMFDPVLNKTFSMRSPPNGSEWWAQNEHVMPIWTANQYYGEGRSSGCVCWAGSDAEYFNITLDRRVECNKLSFKKSIDTVMSWFTDTEKPINFGALYFDEPDKTGHDFGPFSKEMNKTLRRLDKILQYLLNSIENHGLTDKLNVILTSDHGMFPVDSKTNFLILSDKMDTNAFKAYGTATVMNIFPTSNASVDSLYHNLSNIRGFNVYHKGQLRSLHYRKNCRIGPLVLVADPGYQIFKTRSSQENCTMRGNHGYHNELNAMYAIFMASGPAFKKGHILREFRVVDVYPLMLEILGIRRFYYDGNLMYGLSALNRHYSAWFELKYYILLFCHRILMSPFKQQLYGLSVLLIASFIGLLFSFAMLKNVICSSKTKKSRQLSASDEERVSLLADFA